MIQSGLGPRDYVECPVCSVQVATNTSAFLEGRSITCANGHSFNVFAVYRDLYQRIPLATGIGQKLSDAVYRSYRVRGTGQDTATIDAFLNSRNFTATLHGIALDTVVYGNSVVDVLNTGPQQLQKVELADSTLEIESGAIRSIITSQGNTVGSDYILFTHNRGSGGPLGMSAFGAWFQHFYTIRDAPRALGNASILRNLGVDPTGLRDVSQIRDYFANAILTGADLAGYQYSLISDPSRTLQNPAGLVLRTAIDARRAEIRGRVERDVFPLALNRPWQPRDWPQFEITGL